MFLQAISMKIAIRKKTKNKYLAKTNLLLTDGMPPCCAIWRTTLSTKPSQYLKKQYHRCKQYCFLGEFNVIDYHNLILYDIKNYHATPGSKAHITRKISYQELIAMFTKSYKNASLRQKLNENIIIY